MSTVPTAQPACGSEHCITCGDQALAMRVMELDAATSLAECRLLDELPASLGGEETVDVSLLDEVAVGDVVLVHAATALTRLEPVAVSA